MSASRVLHKLNQGNLPRLALDVQVPRYDRTHLEKAIVHLGVGGFHRAHQAVYLDTLLDNPSHARWGESGIGLLPGDRHMRDALLGQDHLYTVLEQSAESQTARVIGSMVEYIFAPEQREAALARMADAATRIVSLTITEGGYFLDEGTGSINLDHPDIRHDLAHPHEPVTSVGYMVEALHRRELLGLAPFTVMSCDNLQGNGHVVKQLLLAYAGMRDSGLQKRIDANVRCPNSMVDRITPGTTEKDKAFLKERFGIDDAWPVVTEPYIQWVIEDDFGCGRPHWEAVGVQMVTDVGPYELMKIRLLNGSHLAMGYLGALAGYTFVHELMGDESMRLFIQAFMEEVTPAVPSIAGVSITQYKQILLERFANPTMSDQVTRICSDGSAKLPRWLLPTLADLLHKGAPVNRLALVIASWIQYLRVGTDEAGNALTILDPRVDELVRIARTGGKDPLSMLSVESIFGPSVSSNADLVNRVREALRMLSERGAIATLKHYTADLL